MEPIRLPEQKNAQEDGEEGGALPDTRGITDVRDLQSIAVGYVGKEKEGASHEDLEGIMPETVKSSFPESGAGEHHECQVTKLLLILEHARSGNKRVTC